MHQDTQSRTSTNGKINSDRVPTYSQILRSPRTPNKGIKRTHKGIFFCAMLDSISQQANGKQEKQVNQQKQQLDTFPQYDR